jgi:hypothetical protein
MIKLRGRAGADNIKALRAILKALLRRHQVRCISACEIIKKNPNTIRKRWSRRLTNRGNFVWRLIAYGIRYEIIQQGNHYYCYSDGDYIYDHATLQEARKSVYRLLRIKAAQKTNKQLTGFTSGSAAS